MSNKLQIHGFDMDADQIPMKDIEAKYNTLSKKRKYFFKQKFDADYDFLILLYHLKFIKRFGNREIAKILGYKNAVNVYLLLYDLGWDHPSDNIDNNTLQKARDASASLDAHATQHGKLKVSIEKAITINNSSYLNLGFKSSEEYARVYYYLTDIEKLSPTEISHFFNLTLSMTQHHIKYLGLNKTRAEGMADKKRRGSHDYGEGGRAANITRRKAQYKNFAPTSSSNEEYFRRQLSDVIYSHFDPKEFEIVVGVNNLGIITREVDIPVLIYKPKQNELFRFAIEYKDPRVHVPQKDLERENFLTQKGWNYLEVIDIPEYSNNRYLFDDKVDEVCSYIASFIDANEDKETKQSMIYEIGDK